MVRGRKKKSKASTRKHRAKFGRISKSMTRAGYKPGTKTWGTEFKRRWKK